MSSSRYEISHKLELSVNRDEFPSAESVNL
jgi:hypothetical protein